MTTVAVDSLLLESYMFGSHRHMKWYISSIIVAKLNDFHPNLKELLKSNLGIT